MSRNDWHNAPKGYDKYGSNIHMQEMAEKMMVLYMRRDPRRYQQMKNLPPDDRAALKQMFVNLARSFWDGWFETVRQNLVPDLQMDGERASHGRLSDSKLLRYANFALDTAIAVQKSLLASGHWPWPAHPDWNLAL